MTVFFIKSLIFPELNFGIIISINGTLTYKKRETTF